MKSVYTSLLSLVVSLSSLSLNAQIDTLVLLPEMEVLQIRQLAVGTQKYSWDSVELKNRNFNSLADFLVQNSNIYVKSYGGNSLSTLSIRGASASQTLLLWNGLPVQSPMLGLLDLSLIPLRFSDNIKLQTGGNSSSWGSGAIGGVLALENKANYDNTFELDYLSSIGSFSSLHQELKVAVGNEKFRSSTQLNFQKSNNDILVRPAPNVANYRQENAAFLQTAILQSFYFKPTIRNEVTLHAWIQESSKEIPPTLTQRSSEAFQKDNFLRFMGTWAYSKERHFLQTRLGHFREVQDFQDPQIQLEALNKFQNTLAELSYSLKINVRHGIEISNTNTVTNAASEAYEGTRQQIKSALLFAYRFKTAKTQIQLSLREEWVDKRFLYPVPYFGWQQALSKNLLFKTKITREFRLPTLNDLYWNPGGNSELKAEEGWGQEIGINWRKEWDKHRLSFDNTAFNRNIKNWILWAPSDVGFFWGASNIAKVWSYGISSDLEYQLTINKFNLISNTSFNYINSSYQVNLDLPQIEKGDQLLYTPKFQGNTNLRFQYDAWSLQYQHQFVGETQGANDQIPAYQIGNVFFAYAFQQENFSGRIFTSINNIYNQNYLVIERRPMPGRNVQLGINLNFKK